MGKQRLDSRGAEDADPLRVKVLATARRFKRSWVEMAAALVEVRGQRAFEAWGYSDLYAYCAEELLIKPRTVDKLTGSYGTLERHAPELLQRDVERPLPSFDAIDYFARMVGSHSDDPPRGLGRPEVLDELRHAVFEEARPVTALRRQFNPLLQPRSEDEQAKEAAEKASAAARRLAALLPGVRALRRSRINEVVAMLEELQRELDDDAPQRRAG
jgi:hypothetical protein